MSDDDLTPEEQQVRRLLADARHDQPMPDDVADRLDGVLADLEPEPRRTSPVVDLASRRRRQTARNLLVAAAAVVVIGVGISRMGLSVSNDEDAGGSSAPESSALDNGPTDGAGGGDAAAAAPSESARVGILELTPGTFDQRLHRLGADQDLSAFSQGTADDAERRLTDLAGRPAPTGWCDDPAWGRGARIAVRYDGQRGVLVLGPASGGTRDIDLYLCGETTPTRSTTVPAS